jgi:hypothetical protein
MIINDEAANYAVFFSLLLLPPSKVTRFLPSTLFLIFLNLCWSLNVTDQISHPHKTSKYFVLYILIRSWYSDGLPAGRPGFNSRQYKIFLFTASRPIPGPTQPPIQYVPGAMSLEVNQPGCEANRSPPSTAKVKNGEAIPPLPICLHGIVLNLLSTGTTSPFPYWNLYVLM